MSSISGNPESLGVDSRRQRLRMNQFQGIGTILMDSLSLGRLTGSHQVLLIVMATLASFGFFRPGVPINSSLVDADLLSTQ